VRLYNYPLTAAEVADLYGLVGWYRCEETSGSTAADSSGKQRPATVVGTPQWDAAAKEGSGALRLDGTNYLQAAGLPVQGPHAAIAGWAKLTGTGGLGADLANLGDHLVLRLDETTGSRGVNALAYRGPGYDAAASGWRLAGTGWHHYAALLNAASGTVEIHVDAVLRGTAPASTALTFQELLSNVAFGSAANGGGEYRLVGTIDDLRIYSRPLSVAELRTLYFGKFNRGVRIVEYREVP
jgi:hypothetical protein